MKILSKEIVYATKYLNFVSTRFINKNNKEDNWYSAERQNDGKTVVVAALLDNKLVVAKEFRVAIGDYEWGLPAGLVDSNEMPETTAKRELKEETNLELVSVSYSTPYLTNSAGMTNEVASIVFCHAQGITNQKGNEQTEEIETFILNCDQVKELIADSNKKFSAKAYLIFERFIRGELW